MAACDALEDPAMDNDGSSGSGVGRRWTTTTTMTTTTTTTTIETALKNFLLATKKNYFWVHVAKKTPHPLVPPPQLPPFCQFVNQPFVLKPPLGY